MRQSVDIYNRWPGFFALAAAFSSLSGASNPVAYAAWAEPFYALVARSSSRRSRIALSRNVRIAGYAALISLLGNWVGQTYYSPQATAYVLALTLLLVLVRTLVTRPPHRRLITVIERLARTPQLEPARAEPLAGAVASVAIVIGLDAAIVATHQLTPYVLLLQVGALVLIGVVRPRWLLAAMALLTVGYLLPNLGSSHTTTGCSRASTRSPTPATPRCTTSRRRPARRSTQKPREPSPTRCGCPRRRSAAARARPAWEHER